MTYQDKKAEGELDDWLKTHPSKLGEDEYSQPQGPSVPPKFKKKAFIPAKDTTGTVEEIERLEKERSRQYLEERERLGREAQQIYREILAMPSKAKKKRKLENADVKVEEEKVFCDICKDHYPKSWSHEDHLRSIAHLVSEQRKSSKHYYINATNVGYQMLKTMNWDEDQGLGRASQGRLDPIKTQFKRDKTGLGATNLPWKVTHFKSFEKPEEKKQPKTHMSKSQRRLEEIQQKRRDAAIRRVVYSMPEIPYE